tara:strand:+ start:296 stop:1066 length:771 start_codon:yes stop_codon:yes gene_type:complete
MAARTHKNEIWKHIIASNNIDLSKEISYITSGQIKMSKKTWQGKENQFEPRLLCKMDSANSRPEIFASHNISLLSVSNGKYAFMKHNIYVPLPVIHKAPTVIIKNRDSLLLDIGNSETSMLDNMLYNKTIDTIIGEKVLFGPLLGGRHRCTFDTVLGDESLHIQGSQYETDGCYETENNIYIVEAKSIECTDFNVRQLYYPFREVHKMVGGKKNIFALFIYKDKNNIIHAHKFKWGNREKMMDIQHIGYYSFVFSH